MKKKGVFLIYVLFTAVLISIFLLTAVKDMHNSFFLTKRFSGDNKAYWASLAGIEYCQYKIKNDVCWPFLKKDVETDNEQFGNFNVTIKKQGSDGYFIHGKSEKNIEEFCIYFSKKNSSKISDEAKKLEGSNNEISIVPDNFPNDVKDLSYCSYNSMTQAEILKPKLGLSSSNDNEDEGNEDYACINLIVSKNNHKAKVTFPGIYIVSDGRSGGYRSVIEKMFIVDNNNTSPAGIYAGGNININLLGNNSTFKISQTSNLKPEIYCKKNMTVTKQALTVEDHEKYIIPMSAHSKGTIYFGQDSEFQLNDYIDSKNENSFSTNGTSGEYTNFNKQYGINLDTYTEAKDRLFPELPWNKVENNVAKKITFKDIPSGSYVAIYEDLTGLSDKLTTHFKSRYEGYDGGYVLVRLDNNYLKTNGEFDKKKFEDDLKKAKEEKERLIKNGTIKEANSHMETRTATGTNPDGSTYTYTYQEKVYDPEGNDLTAIKNSDRGIIIELLKTMHGVTGANYKDDYENCQDYIICSNKKYEECYAETKGVFDIKTVKLQNVNADELKSETDKTPVITLNKSVKTDNFSLFTLTREKNGDFTEDKTKSTDLIFGTKNRGTSELNLLETRYSENSNEDQEEISSLIANPNAVTLYTTGDSLISGKLSGTGQILSNGYTYFKAGTQLNIDDTNNANKKFTSKIAVYSKKDIQMGVPEGKENSNILKQQIKNVLEDISESNYETYSPSSMVTHVLYFNIKQSDLMSDSARYGVDEKLLPPATPPGGPSGGSNPNGNSSHSNGNHYITLSDYMTKYYGFSYREKQDYISNIVQNNIYKNKNNYYKIVGKDDITIFDYQAPSGFSGIIYTCGNFKTNAINSDLTVNGIIVAYGGSPGKSGSDGSPGKSGGNILLDGCKNFTLTYNSTDIDNIRRLCYEAYPINLTCVYYNRL